MTSTKWTRIKALLLGGGFFLILIIVLTFEYASAVYFTSFSITFILGLFLVLITKGQPAVGYRMRIFLSVIFPILVVFTGPILWSRVLTSLFLEQIFAGIGGGMVLSIILGAFIVQFNS